MNKFNKKNFASREKKYCTGYLDYVHKGNYTLLFHLAAVSVQRKFNSLGLDKINAFDNAEISGANFGQFNMITVSSFCGPQGKVAGYDFLNDKKNKKLNFLKSSVPVYSADSFIGASQKIVGTVENKVFPILPGSHVPCAAKVYYEDKPGRIYAMFAIGIPQNKDKDACTLMEDVGRMEKGSNTNLYLQNLVNSVLTIFDNQKVACKEIYISIKEVEVKKGEIGCAMALLPYVKLARNFFSRRL
jgi:histidine decarboxylase